MIWWMLACMVPEDNSPRDAYNDGLVLMAAENWSAAEEKLLAARDSARTDQELRANAAYNLALSYAQEARTLEESDPESAQEKYEQAIGWFRDVIQLQGETANDARHNLEVCLLSKQALVDRLTQGENGFPARLQRLMENVQVARQSVQELIWQMDLHGDRERPQGYESTLTSLAVQVRELGADALEIANLATDDIERITQIPEEQRSPEEQNQWVSLQMFLPYLDLALEEISGSRRQLRRLQPVLGLDDLDDTMQQLLRAQDQLLAPPERLSALVSAQTQLMQQQQIVHNAQGGQLRLQGQSIPVPSWLDAEWLTDQQQGLISRTQEMDQFFEMVSTGMEQAEDVDPTQLNVIRQALNHTRSAVVSQERARTALSIAQWSEAEREQKVAIRELLLAWEYFSDLKTIVEWTHRDNEIMRALLEQSEEIKEEWSTPEEQETEFRRLLTQNQTRLMRLESLLDTQKTQTLQQIQQSQDGSASDEDPIAQVESLYERAEQSRTTALDALQRISEGNRSTEESLQDVQQVHDALRLLRMMFFTVIEHLQDAAEQQELLWQQTGTESTKPYEEFLQDAPLRMVEQEQLRQRTEMISKELQAMADEMATQGDAQQSEALGDAFVETGLAQGFMQDVVDGLSEMVSDPTVSYDVSEVVSDQQQALEALLRAIQALQPPQQGEEGQDDGEQDPSDQQEPSQGQPQDATSDMSQREAQRKMQAAKEKEAQREQEEKEVTVSGGFVEKDW